MEYINMRLGIDILIDKRLNLLKNKRIGILAHAASITASGKHTIEMLKQMLGGTVTAIFGPEHGLATKAEDMEPVCSLTSAANGIPVYSLYGKTISSLRPAKEMLDKIDVLVIDLQDIGSRYYTYIWTACMCLEECVKHGKDVIVCDRPNPVGGTLVEGGGIESGYESFVGYFSVPVRHGMTMGEILNMSGKIRGLAGRLKIIKMDDWRRTMDWKESDLAWTNPSPNMRSYSAALLYPGMCLVEGTNISEGRGTDTPFEIAGAPFINSSKFIQKFEALSLPGIHAAPTSFIPTKQKWKSRVCNGVRWIISDKDKFRPYLTGLCFVWLCHELYKDKGFKWRTETYEFVSDKPAIDLLTGSPEFRENIDSLKMKDIKALAKTPKEMLEKRDEYLLYW